MLLGFFLFLFFYLNLVPPAERLCTDGDDDKMGVFGFDVNLTQNSSI